MRSRLKSVWGRRREGRRKQKKEEEREREEKGREERGKEGRGGGKGGLRTIPGMKMMSYRQ